MFDKPYTNLTKIFPYKSLIFVPIVIAFLSIGIVLVNDLRPSIDFHGGTWIDLTTSQNIDKFYIEKELSKKGLQDINIISGTDLETGKNKITIITTTFINYTQAKEIVADIVNEPLSDRDIITVKFLSKVPSEKTIDSLRKIFSGKADVKFNETASEITLTGFDLNKKNIEDTIKYYTNASINVELIERNFVVDDFDPLLGKDFWNQSLNVFLIATIFMIFVVFLAFRDIIASLAVIVSAFCDITFALAGMSIFSIPLDPSSLVALITLVGYCVDTNIMLTARVMKTKSGEVNERIDKSFGTGVTMTGTTMAVMAIIIIFSTLIVHSNLAPIAKLNTIASVIFLGLIADFMSTWLTCTGIMKWYIEEKGSKFSLFSIKWKKRTSY